MRSYIPLVIVPALLACGELPPETPSPPNTGIHSVSLTSNGSTIAVGDSLLIQATSSNPVETSFNWSSGNPAVATVSPQGWVGGLAVGDVDIIACIQSQNSVCGSVTIKVR
jgi:hypothetical protein